MCISALLVQGQMRLQIVKVKVDVLQMGNYGGTKLCVQNKDVSLFCLKLNIVVLGDNIMQTECKVTN